MSVTARTLYEGRCPWCRRSLLVTQLGPRVGVGHTPPMCVGVDRDVVGVLIECMAEMSARPDDDAEVDVDAAAEVVSTTLARMGVRCA